MNPATALLLANKLKEGTTQKVKSSVGFFQNPKNEKIIKIGALIIASYIVYRVVKSVMNQSSNREEVQSAKTELDRLNNSQSTKQKISPYQAQSLANTLFATMDGLGTDNVAVKSIFYKLHNDADFLALSDAFGVRTISSGKLNPVPDFKGTMASAIRSEMSWDLVKELNVILAKKKIKMRI